MRYKTKISLTLDNEILETLEKVLKTDPQFRDYNRSRIVNRILREWIANNTVTDAAGNFIVGSTQNETDEELRNLLEGYDRY